MISSVVPEFIEGVEKHEGSHASFWLLDPILASSTHPVYLRLGPGYVETCDTEVHQEGLLVFFSFLLFFFSKAIASCFKNAFLLWMWPRGTITCLQETSQLLWGMPNPQQVVNLSWDGVSSPAGLQCSNPAWSFFRITFFVVILTAVAASSSLPALAETYPNSSCSLCGGCGADSCPQSWLWGMNPAVWCLIKMPGCGWPNSLWQ